MAIKAFDQVWKSVTGIPVADMTTKRYTFVAYDPNGNVVTPAAGGKVVGVNYETNKAGEQSMIVAQGYAFVILGADTAAGIEVMSDVAGKAVTWDGAATPAHRSAGVLAVGGLAGDIVTVFLN